MGGGLKKKHFHWGGVSILWNYTFLLKTSTSLSVNKSLEIVLTC